MISCDNKSKITQELVNERYKIFNEAKTKLKKDFYGIDNEIDKIFKSIETWYIYPEYMTRPCIVNLWGLSGVGKTDLVRKLKEYLKINYFASTEMDNTSGSLEDTLNSSYINLKNKSIFDILNQFEITPEKHSILLLDEIHRYRTIDINGNNITRNRYNDVWRLLSDGSLCDSSIGIYKINEAIENIETKYDSIRMNTTKMGNTLEEKLSYMLGNFNVDKKELEKEKKEKMDLVKKNGFIPYEYRRENMTLTEYDNFTRGTANGININNLLYVLNIDEEDLNKLKMYKLIYQGCDDYWINEIFLNSSNRTSDNFDLYCKYFTGCSNKVLLEWLKYKKKKIIESHNKLTENEIKKENMKYIFSKMLIFICGNIDKEVYIKNEKEDSLNIFPELNKLFRPEQITRFGNTFIIYPILKEETYDKIIEKEINFIENNIKEEYKTESISFDVEKIKREVKENLTKDYIYNGVRPVVSEVNRVLSTIIPSILISLFKSSNKQE